MDGAAFDRLSRTVRARGTRRQVLGLLTASPLAGLLAAFGLAETVARRRRGGRRSSHRPGKHKDNRKGKRTGSSNNRQDECIRLLRGRGCRGVGQEGFGLCPPAPTSLMPSFARRNCGAPTSKAPTCPESTWSPLSRRWRISP
jgi:hypothetical protein